MVVGDLKKKNPKYCSLDHSLCQKGSEY